MKKTNFLCTYLVEGECEIKLIKELKNKNLIIPGKVNKFNTVQDDITPNFLRMQDQTKDKIFVLIFDLDVLNNPQNNIELIKSRILNNIKKLKMKKTSIVVIPQNKNLEDELLKSTTAKDITKILNCKSKKDWKSCMIATNNLYGALQKVEFDFNKLWDSPLPTWLNNSCFSSTKIKIR